MERYEGVHGAENVRATTEALEASGARILSAPKPNAAPFEYRILTPQGEVVDLICYVFTANKYGQEGRPDDEHRFQVKYGSEFDRYHHLYIDEEHRKVTLMYGWHEELQLFVAVDPVMHTPTWFSTSVEFKEAELQAVRRSGWHGWERDRQSGGRRKREAPLEAFTTESVLGFTPKNFLRYVNLERLTSGMDPGERLLVIDRIENEGRSPGSRIRAGQHPLEVALGLTAAEILDVLGGSFRLLVAVRGSVAEHHLENQLNRTGGISNVVRIDEDGKADFEVTFERRRFRLECKNVLRRQTRFGPRVDFQKTRAAKGDPCSRYYSRDQFEVLAACLHPVTEEWEFKFVPTSVLPKRQGCPNRISEKIDVGGPSWDDSLPAILERCLREERR